MERARNEKAKVELVLCREAPAWGIAHPFRRSRAVCARLAVGLVLSFESVDGCLQLGNRLVLLSKDSTLVGVEFGKLSDTFGLLIGDLGLFDNQVRQLVAAPGLIVGTLSLLLELTNLRFEIVRRLVAREGRAQATFEVSGKRNAWAASVIIVRRLGEASKAIVESAQHFFFPVGVLDDGVDRLAGGHHLGLSTSHDLGRARRDFDAAAVGFVVKNFGGGSVGLDGSVLTRLSDCRRGGKEERRGRLPAQLERFQTLLNAGKTRRSRSVDEGA
ncbi:hypothetical protein IWX90DRAFT_444569 [Phyllosticta citrichinensis]|uniref:Uncharacterized protein n=1 Tax=Phyllosticta citrichinensis TaxID=1130410 RepID=A0ABR1XHU1_9PEZI